MVNIQDLDGLLKVMLQMNGISGWKFQTHYAWNRDSVEVVLYKVIDISAIELIDKSQHLVANRLYPIFEQLKKLEEVT